MGVRVATGKFRTPEQLDAYFKDGVKKVIVAATRPARWSPAAPRRRSTPGTTTSSSTVHPSRSADESYELQARSPGASPAQLWLKVTLPLLGPGVAVAAMFAFLVS